MAKSNDDPSHRYANERRRVKSSDLSESDTQAVLEFLAALDPEDYSHSHVNDKGEQETLSHSSLQDYGRGLRLLAQETDGDLLDATLEDVKAGFNAMDVAKQTVRQRQAAARKFYTYHDTGFDPKQIPLASIENGSSVDERTTLTKTDIQAVREACDNLRDRALLELLVYTGQRIRAIQTLRIKDIDLDKGVYYLNTEEAGLKNAEKVGGKRPLLGAEKAVRQWITQGHPTGDPEDYVITSLPSATGSKPKGEYLSKIAIYNRLQKLFEESGVEKPDGQMAHSFRHYFVTVAYRDFNMDSATIKYLIGHAPGSTVMETTYKHLTDQDHVDAARSATGMQEVDDEESDTALTPELCPTCDEPLPPNAKACPDCGMVFTPDAKAAKEQAESDMWDSKGEEPTEDEDEALDKLKDLLSEHPELVAELD